MPSAATLIRGFDNPVHDGQRVFRRLLDAMAHPGRIVELDVDLPATSPLQPAAFAVLLALADFETPLWLSPGAASPDTLAAIRFHCGAPVVADPSRAAFAVAAKADERPQLDTLDLGSDAYPERAATLIVQVDALGTGREVALRGPGIDGTARLAVDGLDGDFWSERKPLEILFPRGLDLVLVHDRAVVTIPRSTVLEV